MARRSGRLTAVLTIAVVGALTVAPVAGAQSSGAGYGGQSGVAGQVSESGGNTAGTAGGNQGGVAGETAATNGTVASQAATGNGNGVLAFTGLDLALLAGGGLVLLAAGVALSRLVGRAAAEGRP
jgi:hypothetical protein